MCVWGWGGVNTLENSLDEIYICISVISEYTFNSLTNYYYVLVGEMRSNDDSYEVILKIIP